jgi:hypothetical protein
MELLIGAKRMDGIWHGYVEVRKVPDVELRALTEGIALGKAERAARKIAERKGSSGHRIVVSDASRLLPESFRAFVR